jgi:hypothetical protein
MHGKAGLLPAVKRKDIEKRSGKPVVTNGNFKRLGGKGKKK